MTHVKANMGLFSRTSFITVGDPYEKKEAANDRIKGRQFQPQPQKRGQIADNWGNKKRDFMPLFEGNAKGEPYYAQNEFVMKNANLERQKCLQPDGFKYSSPAKLQCSVGDNFGCFGRLTYKEPFNPVKKGDLPPPVAEVPMNIKTNPVKKGSYGANWKTILGTEYEYKPEPIGDLLKKRTEERLDHEVKMLDRKPFRAMSKTLDFFDEQRFCAASRIYGESGTKREIKPVEKVVDPYDRKPFYPARVPRTGYNATMNKFPEYKPDNFMDRQKDERAAAAEQRAKIIQIFKPGGNSKALPVVPVMTHPSNINFPIDTLNLPSGTSFTAGLGAGE